MAESRPGGDQIAAVRAFTRFYTRQLGLLGKELHDSGFSLTQARVLYELAHASGLAPGELSRQLGLDAGYMSRLVGALQRRGLVRKTGASDDRRRSELALTRAGRAAFATLDRASQDTAAQALEPLSAADRSRLVDAMATVQRLLGSAGVGAAQNAVTAAAAGAPAPAPTAAPAYLIRPPRPGDWGMVISRQGALYASEYGWDDSFEALVAEIVARFVRRYDPKHERCWIAEKDGQMVGSIFLVRQSVRVGKLRLLYVDASARGLGIGARLVDECIAEARRIGYRKLTLWTNDVLVSARRIYQAQGFVLVKEEHHSSFGKDDLVGQHWDLQL